MAWKRRFGRILKTIAFMTGYVAALMNWNDARHKGQDLATLERQLGKETVTQLIKSESKYSSHVQHNFRMFWEDLQEAKKLIPKAKTAFQRLIETKRKLDELNVDRSDYRVWRQKEEASGYSDARIEFRKIHIEVLIRLRGMENVVKDLKTQGFDLPPLRTAVEELRSEYWNYLESERKGVGLPDYLFIFSSSF